jgi:hypothetical protein
MTTRRVVSKTLFLGLLLAGCLGSLAPAPATAQTMGQGRWTTLPYLMPINPVHVALMNNGKVLIVSGSGNLPGNADHEAAVWDPQTGTLMTQPVGWDMFCNGMVVLPDGRVFINGGTFQYDPFFGEVRSSAYDPTTGQFTDLENMAHGRWYPTVTTLGDGSVMTFSGLSDVGLTNTTVEIYRAGSGWSQEYQSGWTPPLYPRMHLLPDGNVFVSGSAPVSAMFNTTTKTWSPVAWTNYAGTRTYGSSVLLPLTPADGYRPRVMIFGGGDPATATTEIIDLSAPAPQWRYGPSMSQPRIEMNATILPNGRVLALGGSAHDEDATSASLNADLYDPATNTFSSAGANAFPRLYHSNALLLPDATVVVVGGNPQRGTYEPHMEIYAPAYLFNVDGSPATRPTITSLPGAITYGSTFPVQTPDASGITAVVLMRPGAPTHAFDMDQRLVRLAYTAGTGGLTVTAPPSGNIAPPGYYMVFILNAAGVPSLASFVQLSAAADFSLAAAPAARTTLPGGGTSYTATVTAGPGFTRTVAFSVSGVPAGARAVFEPASVAGSGSATLNVNTSTSTPFGAYQLTVTGDSGGRAHSVTVTLIVGAPPVPTP